MQGVDLTPQISPSGQSQILSKIHKDFASFLNLMWTPSPHHHSIQYSGCHYYYGNLFCHQSIHLVCHHSSSESLLEWPVSTEENSRTYEPSGCWKDNFGEEFFFKVNSKKRENHLVVDVKRFLLSLIHI